MKLNRALMIAVVAFICGIGATTQTESTVDPLRTYSITEKRVSEVDWNLLQFNLLWHDAYGDGEYVKSRPVFFDYESMTFKARLRVAEKRWFDDDAPFFSLSESQQRATLQGVSDYLLDLLSKNFPKVSRIEKHLEITFVYLQPGGGSSDVGVYRDGKLIMLTK